MNEQVNPHETATRFVVHHTASPRELGKLRGKIWIASDFAASDEDLIDLMENGPIFPGEADWLRG